MIPCPIKLITEHDCPGCGIQRSVFSLLDLDFKNSFHFYPPLLLGILFTVLFLIFKTRFKNLSYNQLIYLNLIIIFTDYFTKLL